RWGGAECPGWGGAAGGCGGLGGKRPPAAARAQMAAQRRHDERLDLGGGNAADQSGRRGLILQHGLGDVIAVSGAALVGVGWAHAVAAIIKKVPAQERGRAP